MSAIIKNSILIQTGFLGTLVTTPLSLINIPVINMPVTAGARVTYTPTAYKGGSGPVTTTRTWYLDLDEIPWPANQGYILSDEDVGKSLTVRQTASDRISTVHATSAPVIVQAKPSFNIVPYDVVQTEYATINTTNIIINVTSIGQTIKVKTGYISDQVYDIETDTYIRLFNELGDEVVENDDTDYPAENVDDYSSYIEYVTTSVGNYTLKLGCVGNEHCVGKAKWSIE